MSSQEPKTPPVEKVETPKAPAADQPAAAQKPRRQPRYNVVLLDDNDHTYDYVIDLLQRVFGFPKEQGLLLAKEVDSQKRAVLMTTTLEHAELKQEQIHGFGPDKAIASCQGGMTAVLEPVPVAE